MIYSMKKILLFLVLICCLTSCCFNSHNVSQTTETTPEWSLPDLCMVNDTIFRYIKTVDIDLNTIEDGTVEIVTDNEFPTQNNETNFGEIGMKYWLIDKENLYIEYNNNIFYFIPESNFE